MNKQPLIHIGGLPCCGSRTLARALRNDLGIRWYNCEVHLSKTHVHFLEFLEDHHEEPIIVTDFLIEAACDIVDMPGWDFTTFHWAILDEKVANRNGWYIAMVDIPSAVEERIRQSTRIDRNKWPRERLGQHINVINRTMAMSRVQRRGTYTLDQFLCPDTGERSWQYNLLVEKARKLIEENCNG
jgi:hypothetical protein